MRSLEVCLDVKEQKKRKMKNQKYTFLEKKQIEIVSNLRIRKSS